MVDRKIKLEKCVLCDGDTDIAEDTPIDLRKYYIQGAGQLCPSCYEEIYYQK